MKNYELIAELSKMPAGAEVSFEAVCTANQVDVREESNGDIFCCHKQNFRGIHGK